MNHRVLKALVTMLVLATNALAYADEPPPTGTRPSTAVKPTAQHALMAKMVGQWNTTLTISRAGHSIQSKGTKTRKMLLDGLYLQEEFTGDMLGMKCNGLGFMGYDVERGKFFMVWMDNLRSSAITTVGDFDESTNTFTFYGEQEDLELREKVRTREVIRMISDNEQILEMYRMPLSSRQEVKIGEARSTRIEG